MVEISILFYNWKRILTDSKSNKQILDIIENLTKTQNPLNKKYVGKSFLLQPKTLLSLAQCTIDEKLQILQIASTRNYFDYWLRGFKDVYLDFCGVSEATLKLNRFIKIDYKNRLIKLLHEG